MLFDLDSTLLNNRPRQARILREFGAAGAVAPLLSCALEAFRWLVAEGADAQPGLCRETEVENPEPQAKQYWRDRFFYQREHCVDDVALAGAVDFVQRCKEPVRVSSYCRSPSGDATGRRLLRTRGLPDSDEDRVSLLMKPQSDMHDDDWKLPARDQTRQRGQLIAALTTSRRTSTPTASSVPDAICVHLSPMSRRGISVHLEHPVDLNDFEFNT